MNIFKRIIFIVCLLASANVMAVAISAKASGPWNLTSTWSTGTIPTSSDAVTIAGTFTVTLDASVPANCASLTVGTAAVVGELIIGGTGYGTPSFNGAGNLTVAGAVVVAAKGTLQANPGLTATSTMSIGGNITLTAPGVFNMSPSMGNVCDVTIIGTSTITGVCTFNNLIINASGKTVTCNTSNQNIAAGLSVIAGTLSVGAKTLFVTEGNITGGTLVFTTGILSVSDSLIIGSTGALSFSTGNVTASNDIVNSGTLTYTGAGTLDAVRVYNNGNIIVGSASITPTGNITNYGSGTITVSTGKINPTGTGKLINSSSMNPAISITSTGTITTGGDLDISAGTIATSTGLITVGGNLNLSGTGTIIPTGAGSITIPTGNLNITGTTSAITLNGAANLNVTAGTASINNTNPTAVTLATGTLSVHGTTSIGGLSGVKFSTGTFTATGDLTNNGEIHYTGAGKLNIGGNYTFNGTFVSDLGTTTTTVNGTANQTLGGTNPITFDILVLNNATVLPNNFITLGTPLTTNGTFTITKGTFDVSPYDYSVTIKGNYANNYSKGAFVARKGTVTFSTNTLTIGGTQTSTFNDVVFSGGVTATLALANDTVLDTLNIAATGTFKNSTFQLYVGNAFLDNGTFTTGTGVLNFGGNATTGNYIGGSSGITVTNITVNLKHQTDTLYVTQSNLSIGTALVVTTGVLHSQTNSITATPATTTFNLGAGTTFILGLQNNTTVPTYPAFKTSTLNATSTVIYQANASQIISTAPVTYGNLYVYTGSATTNNTLSSATAFTVAGNLIIGDGLSTGVATLTATTNAITIQNNFTVNNNGVFAPGTGTITMAATLAQNRSQTIGGTALSATFYNLTIDNLGSKAVALGYPITINNTTTITLGTLDVTASNYKITCNGGWANNSATVPSFNAENGLVNFTNGANVNISGTAQTTFYNLNINTAPTFSVTVTGSHLAPAEIVGHELNVNSGTLAMSGVKMSVSDSANIISGATISFTNSANSRLAVANDLSNNGTISFAAAGTLAAKNIYNNVGATFTGAASTDTAAKVYNYSGAGKPMTFTTGILNITDSLYNDPTSTISYSGAAKLLASAVSGSGHISNSGTLTFAAGGTLTAQKFYNNASATYTGTTSVATIGYLYNYSTVASPGSIYFTTGTINISASDSAYNAAGATIAFSGAGTLNATNADIDNYGTISTVGAGVIKANNLYVNNGGTLTGTTYTGTMSGNVTTGTTGQIILTTGTLNVGGVMQNNGTLQFGAGGNLKLAGNFIQNGTYTYGSNTTTFNGVGTLQTISGTGGAAGLPLQFYNVTLAGAASDVVTLADSVQVHKLLTLTTGVLDVSASGYNLILNGGLTNNNSTSAFVPRTGRVYFIGTQTLNGTSSTNFNDTRIEGGTLTISKPTVIQDTLDLLTSGGVAGTFVNASPNTVSIGNAFFDNSTGNFASNSGIILFTGNTTSKNYIGSAGLKTMTIQKLTMNLANPTDTLFLVGNNVLTVSTNDTLEKGVFHCQQYNFKGAAATKLDVQDNATLILGSKSNATAVTFPLNVTAANTTLTNNSTVIYEANANQAIFNASNYGNLYCYSGNAVGGSTKTPAANLTINGNLIVGDATSPTGVKLPANAFTVALLGNATINTDGNLTFTTAAGALNIGGNFTNNRGAAGFTAGLGTVKFNSSIANQSIGGMNGATHETTNFNNLTIANTFSGGKVTLADSTLVGAIFNINSGTFDVSNSNYSLVVNGGFNNNNTTTSFNGERGIVYFNGSQNIGNGVSSVATTFYDVVCKSGTVTMNAANDSLVANFIAAGGTFAIGNNTLAVDSNVTLNAAGGNITLGSGGLKIGGNFTNNNATAAFTGGTSTTTFNGSGTTQAIGGSATTTFNNVAISGYNVIIVKNETAAGTFKINSGGTFDCGSLTTMTVTGSFTNASGGTFLGDNGTLALSADLTNNSTFTAQTGTVSFNNNGAENINGTNAVSFYNATLNNAAVVNINTKTESLQNMLTLNNTSQLAGTGSDSLIMLSTPALTARIAPVAAGASITLPFTMQRYVSGTKAAYEALAAPSQASTLHDWAYDPGFYMSGVGGPDGNAGGFQSVYTINEPTDAYVAVTTTSQPLTPGLGLYIYMANSLSTFAPFTFATHGLPTYGTFTYSVTHSNTGSNLVGNPYDCPLSWTALRAQGSNTSLLGNDFSVYDRSTGNWESSDGTTASCVGCALASQPNVIPEHQGFLVLANTAGSMTFAEAAKTTTLDQPVYGPVVAVTPNYLRITLTENVNTYSGNALIGFDNAAQTIYDGKEDVLYRKGLTEGAPVLYTLSSDAKFLSRNLLPATDGNNQDIMFYAGGDISGNYTLTFTGINDLTKYNCVQLEDLKTGKLVQVEEGTTYTYQLTTGANYKFILHFKKLEAGAACVLPVMANVTNESTSEAVDVFRNEIGAEARFTLTQTQQAIITVYNTLGQQVGQEIVKDVMDESVQIPLPSTNAMYIIRIQTPSGVTTKRIYR